MVRYNTPLYVRALSFSPLLPDFRYIDTSGRDTGAAATNAILWPRVELLSIPSCPIGQLRPAHRGEALVSLLRCCAVRRSCRSRSDATRNSAESARTSSSISVDTVCSRRRLLMHSVMTDSAAARPASSLSVFRRATASSSECCRSGFRDGHTNLPISLRDFSALSSGYSSGRIWQTIPQRPEDGRYVSQAPGRLWESVCGVRATSGTSRRYVPSLSRMPRDRLGRR